MVGNGQGNAGVSRMGREDASVQENVAARGGLSQGSMPFCSLCTSLEHYSLRRRSDIRTASEEDSDNEQTRSLGVHAHPCPGLSWWAAGPLLYQACLLSLTLLQVLQAWFSDFQ